jgi:hypothetical protein
MRLNKANFVSFFTVCEPRKMNNQKRRHAKLHFEFMCYERVATTKKRKGKVCETHKSKQERKACRDVLRRKRTNFVVFFASFN